MEIDLHPSELDRYRMEGRMVLCPYRTRGLIDTAAEITCIKSSVADELLLEPVGQERLETASGEIHSAIYYITLRLGWNQEHPPDPIQVSAHSAEITGAEMLIGLDVLWQGKLIFYGPERRFELILPREAKRPT